MPTAKVQAGQCIRAVSPETMLYDHVSGSTREKSSQDLAEGPGMISERLIRRKVRRAHSRDKAQIY